MNKLLQMARQGKLVCGPHGRVFSVKKHYRDGRVISETISCSCPSGGCEVSGAPLGTLRQLRDFAGPKQWTNSVVELAQAGV
jgi:hypothetical protein